MATAFFWLTSRPCERTQISSVNCISSRRYFQRRRVKTPTVSTFESNIRSRKLISPQDEIESEEKRKKWLRLIAFVLDIAWRKGGLRERWDRFPSRSFNYVRLVLKVTIRLADRLVNLVQLVAFVVEGWSCDSIKILINFSPFLASHYIQL